MAVKFSTELRRQLCVVGSLKEILDGGSLKVYAGTPPASADAALGGATLLVEVLAAGNELTFEPTATGAVLTKNLTEVWESIIAVTGAPAFFRYELPADTGGQSTSEVRVQGTAGGPGSDLFLTDSTLTASEPLRMQYFAIAIPESV